MSEITLSSLFKAATVEHDQYRLLNLAHNTPDQRLKVANAVTTAVDIVSGTGHLDPFLRKGGRELILTGLYRMLPEDTLRYLSSGTPNDLHSIAAVTNAAVAAKETMDSGIVRSRHPSYGIENSLRLSDNETQANHRRPHGSSDTKAYLSPSVGIAGSVSLLSRPDPGHLIGSWD